MTGVVDVSVIIPTYNRRNLVTHAIETVLAQTHAVDEIIVIDDGSTDGTGDLLRERFGDRVTHVWQDNAGVSAARNRGMAMARGRFLALLDSDDEWLPQKTQRQVEWLAARPDYGMVLCDVVRMTAEREPYEVFHRREQIPEDGWVLKWVLRQPALAPVSAMLRREVYEQIGGFDAQLRTAEDLDFHLRVARRWRIGVIEEPLARAMRGHDGLSSLSQTYDDYVVAIERAALDAVGVVDANDIRFALSAAYARNARGMLIGRRWADALQLARKAWTQAANGAQRREVIALAGFAARRAVGGLVGLVRR